MAGALDGIRVIDFGQYIAGPVFDKEEILYAEIDHDQIIRAKTVIDCSGHFSRPDIFNFEIKDS